MLSDLVSRTDRPHRRQFAYRGLSLSIREGSSAGHAGALVRRLARAVRAGTSRIQRRLKADAVYYELMHLDGRSLNDLGLSRGDVFRAAYGVVQDRPGTASAPANEAHAPSPREAA